VVKDTKNIWFILLALLFVFIVFIVTGCSKEMNKEPEKRVKLAADHQFIVRADGLSVLEETYDFRFDDVHELTVGLTHEALRAEHVDVAKGYTTDGRIKHMSLVSLEDDKDFFYVDYSAPVIREEVLEKYPRIEEYMEELAAELDTSTMRKLNYLVDIKEKEPYLVVREWLIEEDLLLKEPLSKPVDDEPVVIGFKEYTEQKLLGYMTVIFLENRGVPAIRTDSHIRSGALRLNLEKEQIDMCWQNTVNAWDFIRKQKDALDREEAHQKVYEKDIEEGLVWLEPAHFKNAETLLMREEHAEELGIVFISDLAKWVNQVQKGEYTDVVQ